MYVYVLKYINPYIYYTNAPTVSSLVKLIEYLLEVPLFPKLAIDPGLVSANVTAVPSCFKSCSFASFLSKKYVFTIYVCIEYICIYMCMVVSMQYNMCTSTNLIMFDYVHNPYIYIPYV